MYNTCIFCHNLLTVDNWFFSYCNCNNAKQKSAVPRNFCSFGIYSLLKQFEFLINFTDGFYFNCRIENYEHDDSSYVFITNKHAILLNKKMKINYKHDANYLRKLMENILLLK